MKIEQKIDELTESVKAIQIGHAMSPAENALSAVILNILAVISQLNKNITQTANTASCLANGIQPD